jgi:hypothetical protein
MGKDRITEKKFTEYVDRVLAGGEVSASEELSDELRSALDFTRVMLTNRDEPTPLFRAQLREKLLRKLAEQEAAAASIAQRRNPLEWLRELFSQEYVLRIATGVALVVLLVVIGSVWYNRVYSPTTMNVALESMPAGEYSVNLPARIAPDRISVEVKTALSSKSGQAAIYRIAKPVVTTESVTPLGNKLGFSGQALSTDGGEKITMTDETVGAARQLTVWTASGAIEYGFIEPDRLYPTTAPKLPSQNQAKKIAYDFLKRTDLLPAAYQNFPKIQGKIEVIAGGSYSMSAQDAGKTVQKEPAFWLISLPYFVDGSLATGPGAKIEVSVGNRGEVVKLVLNWREMSPVYSGYIKSEMNAYQDLISDKGSLDIPLASDRIVIRQVTLAYWIDPASEQQDYALPVYVFRGECLDKTGRHLEDFTAWTEALRETY